MVSPFSKCSKEGCIVALLERVEDWRTGVLFVMGGRWVGCWKVAFGDLSAVIATSEA